MSTPAVTRTERTYYEVVTGCDEGDRQTYVNYGDGSRLSEHAEVMATREFMRLSTLRVRCGLFASGVLIAGEDMVEAGIAAIEAAERAAEVEHKTRTFCPRPETGTFDKRGRPVRDRSAAAICACGWVEWQDNREMARRAAREHREGSQP